MLFIPSIGIICLALTKAVSSASIAFQNRAAAPVCYKVEISNGSIPTNSICDSGPGIFVNSTSNATVIPSPGFNGAITAMAMNGTKGARHEINFRLTYGDITQTWYDVDYEMGYSDSTLGPANHRNRSNGLTSLAGERDGLTKANLAWVNVTDKSALLPHYYYLDHRATGNLSIIRMDKKAPSEVIEFLQLTAEFNGYMGPGSIAGVQVDPFSEAGKLVRAQDRFSYEVDTQDMEIINYSVPR